MPDPIRVLVADDQAVVRHGLRLFLDLQEDIEVAGEAADGTEAIALASELKPDVVLMDLVMPRLDGIGAIRGVRSGCPEAKVLVLTSFADDDKLFPALKAGAAGYLMKDVEPERLADAIRAVHRGDPLFDPEVTRRIIARITSGGQRPEGTVTVLFTDVEDSASMFEELGDEGARAVFREHDCLMREVFAKHGGVEVKHQGDGFMVAFSGARPALRCAVELQRALARSAKDSGHPMSIRIGLNTGEVIAEEEDYFGEAVILASRIAGRARGGQILVSDLTRALASTGAAGRFQDCGEYELKGLSGAHRLFEIAWE